MQTTTFKGSVVKLKGSSVGVGDKAPVAKGVGVDLKEIEIGGAKERVQLILTLPSLDTDTCAAETRKFNEAVDSLDICYTTVVSMDLPFASQRFCSTSGIENLSVVSDYLDKEISLAYGVLMEDGVLRGLSARAVFVIDRSGVIVYKEIVSDVTKEPDYEAALDAIKGAR